MSFVPQSWEHVDARDIERTSMAIIEGELSQMDVSIEPDALPVVMRAIHATADFDYARNLVFSPDAVSCALDVLRHGACVVTDTNMALAGINKTLLEKLDCEARCFMSEPDVALEASQRHVTRATVSMEHASLIEGPTVFAVGNAPTALRRVCELCDERRLSPSLVICAPVGFVNVEASKEIALETFARSGVPHIVALGRKGGSTVAAAIVNALLIKACADE